MMRKLIVLLLSITAYHSAVSHEADRFYRFIPNKGQFEQEITHKARINNGALFLEKDRFTFHFTDNSALTDAHHKGEDPAGKKLSGHVYQVQFLNANTQSLSEEKPTNEYYNFFLGNKKEKWAGGVHAYEKVNYNQVYAGIDLKVYSQNEQLKYDWIVKANANPQLIQQEYIGLEKIKLDEKGNLQLKTSLLTVTELAPKAYQIIAGKKVEVPCEFKLNGTILSYHFPKGYQSQFDLIIDPVLIFGSSSGSFADNFGMTATYSSQGHLFTGGTAYNIGYPTTVGAYQTTAFANGSTYGVTDVVITKYDPTGASLVYSTYIGGGNGVGGTETVHSLICNANDELFIMGVTSSLDFPTTSNAYDTIFNGGSFIGFLHNGTYFNNGTDLYVTRFDVSGSNLLGSTFIGGSGNDGVNYNNNYLSGGNWISNYDSLQFNYGDQFRGEIMLDDLGNCYVASTTKSSDFPVVNAFQTVFGGQQDGVVFKFDAALSNLIYSTYIGGNNKDAAYSIKVDDAYNAYVSGGTASSNFPTTPGVLHTTFQGGKVDGFVCKISPTGTTLLNSTFIGTSLYDQVLFVEIDRFGSVYLLGQTLGAATYPVVNVNYSNANSCQFITKLTNNLASITYSTLFGNGNGTVNISPAAFLVDVCGNVYVSGWGANILQGTPLNGMPVTPNAFQSSNGDGFNFYLIVFSRDINSLLYATYFGGPVSHEHVDGGTSRFDANGIVYQSVCAGCSNNDDFPTTPGAWSQVNNSTNCNNGVFKFDFEIEPVADFTTDQLAGCAPLTIQFDNTSPIFSEYLWDFGNGDTTSTNPNPIVTFDTPGTYTVLLIVTDSICLLQDTAVKIITVHPPLELYTNDTLLCEGGIYDLIANSNGTSSNFYWSSNPTFTDTLNTPVTDSTLLVNIFNDTVFYVNIQNAWCSYTDTVVITIPELDISIAGATSMCTGDSLLLIAVNNTPLFPLTYNWAPDSNLVSNDGAANVLISPNYSQWFYLTGTTAEGCTVTDSIFINVSGPPSGLVIATADDYEILAGSSTVLHAQPNGYTYVWTPSTSLDNPNSQNPVATPTETTIYTVTVSNGGCSISDTVMIRIAEFICGEPNIYIPNAFTPNNDGENDILYVRGNNIDEFVFKVFDRWGEKVFETTDITIGWNGTFNGRDSDPAVFVWYLEATCDGGEKYFKKGNTTLIR